MTRTAWILAAAVMLAGCAAAPRPRLSDPAALAAQRSREAQLAADPDWALSGRLAISDERDSGSGRIHWREHGGRYSIELAAPVSRRSWRLTGDAHWALLEGLDGGPRRARNADRLLAEALGWPLPLAHLRAWVRGARGPGEAVLEFGPDGLPASMRQSGWDIVFRDWHRDGPMPLPRRVFANRGDVRVRLVVDSWLDRDATATAVRP